MWLYDDILQVSILSSLLGNIGFPLTHMCAYFTHNNKKEHTLLLNPVWMSLNAYLNRFRSVKHSNRVMLRNGWNILMALFPVLRLLWQNNMASAVENASWKPLEMPFLRLLISKSPQMPLPWRTCVFGANSKAAYYSLSACYLKTFWQPWIYCFFVWFYHLVSKRNVILQ